MIFLFSCCSNGFDPHPDQQRSRDHLEETIEAHHRHHPHSQFSFQDLIKATLDFHEDNKLGSGGFGTVYKGTLPDGTNIAVKRLSNLSKQGKGEFINEVNLLTTVQHRNVIKLLGCCVEGSERLLVYEYLENQSLDKCLFGSRCKTHLGWPQRREIIVGTAKGLLYLHQDSRVRIIHRDIKASNILLDINFVPKIADFGLSKLFNLEQTHASTKVAGTFGYLAPEYAMTGRLNEKADIFSFGVVVLEIVSGRKNTNSKLPPQNQRLLQVAWRFYKQDRLLELVDPRLGNDFVEEEVVRAIYVALLCTQAKADLRPLMSRVVTLLVGQSPIADKPTKPPFVGEDVALVNGQSHDKDYEVTELKSDEDSTSFSASMTTSFFSR